MAGGARANFAAAGTTDNCSSGGCCCCSAQVGGHRHAIVSEIESASIQSVRRPSVLYMAHVRRPTYVAMMAYDDMMIARPPGGPPHRRLRLIFEPMPSRRWNAAAGPLGRLFGEGGAQIQVRDFVVSLITLSVYHILVVERYHSPNFHPHHHQAHHAPNNNRFGDTASSFTTNKAPFGMQRPQYDSILSGSGINATATNNILGMKSKAQPQYGSILSTTRSSGMKSKARRIPHPKGPPPMLLQNHSIMRRAGSWAPIVLEEYKLLFFDVPKVGSTGFKQLFLRMKGSDLWRERNADQLHWKSAKDLRTLSNYTIAEAQEMMTSPDWTRAMFVRDPKERLLSAFLDKVERNRGVYAGRACCKRYHYVRERGEKKWGASKREIQCMYEVFTFEGFLHLAATECRDEPHWRSQSQRVDEVFWPYVNFIGYMDNIAEDTKTLLEALGPTVWEEFGASGWGMSGDESIFGSLDNAHHHSIGGALSHYHEYFTPQLEKEADGWLADEYGHTVLQLPHIKRAYS